MAPALLNGLNPAQREAVEAPDGPLLIFAGAGSGKTRVLTHRIARILADGRARPAEIVAVTFTNKAAREMRTRLEALVPTGVAGMWLGTFHSLGVRLLRRDGEPIGVPADFVIYDEADRLVAVRRAMQEAGVDEKRWPARAIVHAISSAKNELLDAAAYAASPGMQSYAAQGVVRTFPLYERALAAAGALDFDDLLAKAVQLLRDVPPVREYYQERFRHIFVDEYQDTNQAQYSLVTILAAKHRNLTVVGDDDQSVYGWRGADVRIILNFERDYPDARTVILDQNYRSTQPILDIAHAVIRHNQGRADKRLWTERDGGDPVRLLSVYDEQEEAQTVCNEIERLVAAEGITLSDCAVLYRTNAQSRAFEDAMLRRGIPYQLVGGVRFYERREIKDVLAYCRLVSNPRDPVSFSRVVNVPRRKIGDRTVAELERLGRRLGNSPFDAIDHLAESAEIGAAATAALRGFRMTIDQLREESGRRPLPELLELLLEETGYRAMVRDGTDDGEERWANIVELSGLAGEYGDLDPPEGLRRFLENVALVSDVDTLDESAPGVTLITLHQVKGLEFPVVFITGMEEGLLPHMRALEEGVGAIEEERRLTYVGITRAQRRLYLVHAFRRHLYGSGQAATASRFLGDVPAGLLDQQRSPGGTGAVVHPRSPGALRNALHARAVAANPVEIAPQRLAEGMRVRHPKYGDGTVLKSTMTRTGEEAVIRFDEAGMKIFMAAEAPLTVVR
ncbi:MAG TPA: UvrD-helicase domain-containing protein [Candidatus Dormibacteraeota bacterium]